jgi:hypothetical protein
MSVKTKFGDKNTAARLRAVIRSVAAEQIDRMRPEPKFAQVISIDPAARRATVRYPGETTTFVAPCGTAIPSRPGVMVRLAGREGSRYIDEVYGATTLGEQSGRNNITTGTNGLVTINFPWTFPTNDYRVLAIAETANTGEQITWQVNSRSPDSMQLRMMINNANAGSGVSRVLHWDAKYLL